MNTEELMFGNIIRKINDKTICSVINIFGPSGLIDYSINGTTIAGSRYSILNFEPIPITHDLLINVLECEFRDYDYIKNYDFDGYLQLDTYIGSEGFYTHSDDGGELITNFHELQNYYRFLNRNKQMEINISKFNQK